MIFPLILITTLFLDVLLAYFIFVKQKKLKKNRFQFTNNGKTFEIIKNLSYLFSSKSIVDVDIKDYLNLLLQEENKNTLFCDNSVVKVMLTQDKKIFEIKGKKDMITQAQTTTQLDNYLINELNKLQNNKTYLSTPELNLDYIKSLPNENFKIDSIFVKKLIYLDNNLGYIFIYNYLPQATGEINLLLIIAQILTQLVSKHHHNIKLTQDKQWEVAGTKW